MSNKVKAMSHSIIDVGGKIGLGGVSGRYKGTASTLWKIGGCLVIGIGVIGIYALPEIKKKLGQVKIDEEKKKNELENDKAREASRLKMEEKDHQCDLDIKKAKEISQVKTDEISRVITIRQDFGLMGKKTVGEQTIDKEPALGEWLQWFDTQFPMPGYSATPHISTILNGCPGGFRPAMLLHLLGTYGALCFSNVRAQYMDGRSHSPSLQVVIVGAQGSGKSIFKNVYEQDLFHRVVMEDREKARSNKPDQIIQTIGSEISKARLLELIAGNHDVYFYSMETEIDTVRQSFTKGGGLSSDLLRKAFSNESISLDNKHTRNECRGTFLVYFNYTFTGTPKAVRRFFKEEEYEDGTASRVCFCAIPELGHSIPEFDLPEGEELEKMRDQIDKWREQYCFRRTKEGIDIPANEHRTDLSYVFGTLKHWIEKQKEMGGETRKEVSLRMATVAFHGAIVLHMLAGEPGEDVPKTRRAICKLTEYLANHCMERFLCQYYKGVYPKMDIPTEPRLGRRLTDEEIECWYPLWKTLDENGNQLGYGRIAKLIGVSKNDVRNAFRKHEKEIGLS